MKKYLYQLATDQRKGIFAVLIQSVFLLLSWVYGGAVWLILFFYRINVLPRHVLPKPVICVGNMTLGGVGKTPFVQFLVRVFKAEKLKPAVLIRGYMDQKGISDEAVMLQESLEGVVVAVGKDRVKTAREAFQEDPVDVFILDDGFQHWRLKRDLDIVLIDAANPFGNGRLIPRGILREPVASLKRAGIIVLTKTDSKAANVALLREKLKKINPDCPVIETVHKPVSLHDVRNHNSGIDLSALRAKAVCSFCGIGDPKSFQDLLIQLGADLKRNFDFMDHHVYTREDVDGIIKYCRDNNVSTIITTQKDAVKVGSFAYRLGKDLSLFSLEIAIEIVKGKDEFLQRIHRVLSR